MKCVVALSLVALMVGVEAFAPAFVARGAVSSNAAFRTQLYSGPEDEEDGLDLNLEEMFDM